jgi:hypothetical protein
MSRPFRLLSAAAALVFVSAVGAADPQTPQPPQPAKGPLPTIINYPSAALQAQPGAAENKNLPVVTSPQTTAGIKPPANAPAGPRQYAAPIVFTNNAIMSAPYAADYGFGYGYGAGYGYAPAYGVGYMAPYGYGGLGYSPFGYTPPMYSAAYTLAYDYWATARPLPTAVVIPAGTISTMPTANIVWQDTGYITNR